MTDVQKDTCLVGIDIGGTFTDIILIENEEITVTKVPSTPKDPSQAVINGLKHLNITSGEFVHGTTIATNTLLENTGALTALITTKGFEDVLEIGRQNRQDLYDFNVQKPEPLANREMRYGISERTDSNGVIIEDLDTELLEQIIYGIKSSDAESVAVSLLFSFLNPAHEQSILKTIQSKIPSLYVSISSEIVPEFREYERTSTVVINSYVGPKVSQYMDNLTTRVEHPIRVMQSSGGSITSQLASKEPVRTILSGPAGGVVGAYRTAKQAGINQIISIDMGGTSTDVSICPDRIQETTQSTISGYPISIPMIEIHTVGAGGGSIAAINAGGSLSVGPSSAGSDPGPACYGIGDNITVTDANLILGRIQPDFFLGGTMQLDIDKALMAIQKLATEINSSATDAALGIIKVVNANMEQAIRTISLERGHDPRDFALLPFGGAGALHACELSAEMGISKVFIPPHPGVLSALGVAIADVTKDYSRTVMLTPGEETLYQ
ncbi:MAG: hydantoinase/oxoprolinase family protein, partial [SAR202 cluster bacterium]|nr:hydantoinase/oxoprolinase family protein [SAR202 cluster bacterium]